MNSAAALHAFLSGACCLGSLAVALFFSRFWKKSHDRIFALFTAAFALLALERGVLSFIPAQQDGRHLIYLARLLAFTLILLGVVQKNRPKDSKQPAADLTRPEKFRQQTK